MENTHDSDEDSETTLEDYIECHSDRGIWGEHDFYPRSDWRDEVANEDTSQGYWEWCRHQQGLDYDNDNDEEE